MSRVAAILTNYNMPERTDALVEFLQSHVSTPLDIIVVDNGSNIQPPSQYTTLRLEKNIQTTAGWLMGLKYADLLQEMTGRKYLAYWFLITSAEFVGEDDPLAPMVDFLEKNPAAVGIHPALTKDSTTSWEHMKETNGWGYRPVFMIDNITSVYRADWFNSIGRFDPAMRYAWGIDLETCWKARSQNRSIWLSEEVPVKKVTDIGYTMNRMNMSADERRRLAGQEMERVLSSKYGPDWWKRMTTEYTENIPQ